MKAVHFSSRIHVVPRQLVHAQIPTPAHVVGELDGDNTAIAPSAFTQKTIYCNAGGVTNGQNVLMFHFNPISNLRNPSTAYQKVRLLNEKIERLAQPGHPLRGFLVGGQAQDADSRHLGQMISRLFQHREIPFSKLWGHRCGQDRIQDSWWSNLRYDAANDTWLVATYRPLSPVNEHGNISSDNAENLVPRHSLRDAFEQVKIDPGDILQIG